MASCVSTRQVIREYLRNNGVAQVNSIRTTALGELVDLVANRIWFGKVSKEWDRRSYGMVISCLDVPMHPNAGAVGTLATFKLYSGTQFSEDADSFEIVLRRCLHGIRGAQTQNGVIVSADKISSMEMPDNPDDLNLISYHAEYEIWLYNRE